MTREWDKIGKEEAEAKCGLRKLAIRDLLSPVKADQLLPPLRMLSYYKLSKG